jgi:biofilm PGA synthesis N-glycosyltransferase PgaC
MNNAHEILWVALILLLYCYAGYPLLLWAWARLWPRAAVTAGIEPEVTLIVVVHNEAARIAERLRNFLELDYPFDKLEILVASDGSSDVTAERARACGSEAVRVIEFTHRRGKSAVLNDVIPRARGEIVILADARQRFATGALRALTGHFADPRVGAVGGELILLDRTGTSEIGKGMDSYWRYEKFIRRHESSVDSTIGVSGSIYALRRRLFRPIDEATILDDVLIPMQTVRQGYRVLFEPGAQAYDWTVPTARAEFVRKLRTIAGNFQLFYRQPWLLNPFVNRLWLQTISHKGLRLLSPLCMALVFTANLWLLDQVFYRCLFAAQLAFYAAAFLGYRTRGLARRPALLNVPYAFCLLNWATVMALFGLLNGRQQVTWERTTG